MPPIAEGQTLSAEPSDTTMFRTTLSLMAGNTRDPTSAFGPPMSALMAARSSHRLEARRAVPRSASGPRDGTKHGETPRGSSTWRLAAGRALQLEAGFRWIVRPASWPDARVSNPAPSTKRARGNPPPPKAIAATLRSPTWRGCVSERTRNAIQGSATGQVVPNRCGPAQRRRPNSLMSRLNDAPSVTMSRPFCST
jgi:hypothetical protein